MNSAVYIPSRINAEEGIAADNVHSQLESRICNETADSSETDNSKSLALDLNARKLGFALLDCLCNVLGSCKRSRPLDTADNVTGSEHKCADSQLLNSVCVSSGGVEYNDTLSCATVNGNVVYSCSRTGNSDHILIEGHIVHSGRADHNSIGVLNLGADVVYSLIELICAYLGYLIETKYVFHNYILPETKQAWRSPQKRRCSKLIHFSLLTFTLNYALGLASANAFMNSTRASTPALGIAL